MFKEQAELDESISEPIDIAAYFMVASLFFFKLDSIPPSPTVWATAFSGHMASYFSSPNRPDSISRGGACDTGVVASPRLECKMGDT